MNTFSATQLILEDGTVFPGFSFGSNQQSTGEVVFNTGMVGYEESLTDPSYRGQILVYTYPLIGNYGVTRKDMESGEVQVRGVITANYQDNYSHWQAQTSLHRWLKKHHVPGITGVDTRALTKKLRSEGVMLGKISPTAEKFRTKIMWHDPNTENLVAEVSTAKPLYYGHGKKKVLLVDCGVKQSIIDNFVQRNISIKRVPWNYNFIPEIKNYSGIFISNGPGDPQRCRETIAHVREAFKYKLPQFGICLGSQIQGLAAGAKTYKLKYGHRGQNQPCVYVNTRQGILTSQNHGYAVREKSLPQTWKVLLTNANDGSVEGINHRTLPFFSVQFHPEAHPGPQDANSLFDEFIRLL